jgi:hypothetical protein
MVGRAGIFLGYFSSNFNIFLLEASNMAQFATFAQILITSKL